MFSGTGIPEFAVFSSSFQNNSLERAVDWIFSHIDDLDAEAAMDISEGRSAAESISESVPVGPKVRDGPGSEFPPVGIRILGCKLNILPALCRTAGFSSRADLVMEVEGGRKGRGVAKQGPGPPG